MDRVKRIWYLSPMRTAKVQVSLRIRAVSPEPLLLAHSSSESRGTFRQKARSLAPLNGWACAVKICHDGMLEDTYSLDGAHNDVMFLPLKHFGMDFWFSHNRRFTTCALRSDKSLGNKVLQIRVGEWRFQIFLWWLISTTSLDNFLVIAVPFKNHIKYFNIKYDLGGGKI